MEGEPERRVGLRKDYRGIEHHMSGSGNFF